MTKRKPNPHTAKARKTDNAFVFPSMKAASASSGVPYASLQALKDQNVPGFERSGRVHLAVVLAHVFTKSGGDDITPPAGMRNWREALNKAQAERQQLKFQQERGRLVERAWVGERIVRAAGELNAFRAKSEAEHPTRFAATSGDVAMCRSIVRGIWDAIFAELHALGKHLEEGAP